MSDAEHIEVIKSIRDAYVQAVKSGQLLDNEVSRQWILGEACKGCGICESILAANQNTIGIHHCYRLRDNLLEMPPAHQGCDCSERYITDLSRVTANPFSGHPAPGVRQPTVLPTIHLPFIPMNGRHES